MKTVHEKLEAVKAELRAREQKRRKQEGWTGSGAARTRGLGRMSQASRRKAGQLSRYRWELEHLTAAGLVRRQLGA